MSDLLNAEYDDDRPGMMRVHIAQQRGAALAQAFTHDHLRMLARRCAITPSRRKLDTAVRLAMLGYTAPDYDKTSER